ncbi:ABC transporter family substrate-binding protein [Nocardia sp. NBC_01503]|uniref:ABC transporter family substrate-binding protein n=1 Tax=Nocardia sp. NBC_01503 TaxID=2975997 RepID=UPI002E7AF249|nr:ABC transporter family substrate-binding protein [Nocardia sp. NBC_01503]WTL34642.1 ABC transporter family substrate-binding protein [Nocardia sp. NBC_01503]
MRSGRGCAAVVLAAGLALVACGGGDTTATGTGELGITADINPHVREDIRDGGDLRLAMTSFPANWNTLQIDGNEGEIAELVKPLMPRSFLTDPSGNLTVDHDYFTDVRMTSTNPQVVSYTINPEAVWSDGSPITWQDIAAQAHALSGKDTRYLIAISNGFDRVAKVERGTDDRQAIITFEKPYADWRGQFAGNSMLYPKQVTADPESFNRSEIDAIGLTGGPFVVRSADRTSGLITLAHNPKWWGSAPKLDTIVYRVLDSNAWTQALQNKEIDAALLRTINDLQNVRAVPGLTIRQAPLNRWRHFTFNGAPGSILADQQLRVAISKAIDRQRIADTMQNGLTTKPAPLNNHIFLRGQHGYQDNSLGFDPGAAAAELDALGWVRDGDGRVKDGKRLVIRDVMYNDDTWVQIAKLIQQDLGKVGVELTIDTRPGSRYFTDVIQPGDFDVCQFVFQGDAFPFNGIPQIYGYHPDNLQANFGRIGSPELNELIDKTLSELDPEKAIELANQVDRKVFEEGHSLPLVQNEGNFGVRSDLANYGAPGLASYDYTTIGFLK